LPTPVQVVLAVRMLAMAEELEPAHQHRATNRVRDPRGELLSEVGGEFSVGAEAPQPDWLNGLIVSVVVQFDATEEGTYTIEQVVDDASASLPIHIVHGPPPRGRTALRASCRPRRSARYF
jgi:hypothetical protein